MIQIAGVIDQAEADLLVRCGVKYIGFPLRLPVHKADLSEEDAAKIIKNLPADVNAILITYLNRSSEILELAEMLGTSFIQLHGEIELSEIVKLRNNKNNLFLIKSLVVGRYDLVQLKKQIKEFSPVIDAFILDTFDATTGACGATGKLHDWSISRKIVSLSPKPVILAGGLNDINVSDAIHYVSPGGVDSHTGVENNDGRKDPIKILNFINSAKAAFNKIHMLAERSLNIRELEALTNRAFSKCESKVNELIIDLKLVEFIEVTSLIYLLALIEKRNSLSLKTTFLIPEKKAVRDFLRLWGFPQAVYDCTGRPFSSICTKEDISKYFSENKIESDFTYASFSKTIGQIINSRFFSISTYLVSNHSENTLSISKESARWKAPLIQNFLKQALDSRSGANYVSSRIVYEAMTNAFRHSDSKLVVSTSFCDEKYKKGSKMLTIIFWDNGKPMQDTLREAFKSGKQVRAMIREDNHFMLKVKHKLHAGSECYTEIKTDLDINCLEKDYEFFLACLFPGVSRDLDRVIYYQGSEETISEPGWGLVALLNCACEIFNGSVSFRSGRLFANVEKYSENPNFRFSASITEYDDYSPKFNGNLVTVRIPIGS